MQNLRQLHDAILTGDAKGARATAEQALKAGAEPLRLVQDGMMPAMNEVGRRFESNEYFVPELLLAARAMKAALELLRPLLAANGHAPAGRVVLGTVQGDLHDIGKNLVGAMFEGGGYEVIDLGANVTPEQFIAAVREKKPDIVAMSALLTTTAPAMKVTIDAMKQAGVRQQVKVIVGGAPITERFAREIGADGYSESAAGAVAAARKAASAEMPAVNFNQLVLRSSRRLALLMATYPGLALTGAKVSDIVSRPQAQLDAQAALQQRYRSPFVLSAMDLSVEAEAFGCTVRVYDSEVPIVTGRLITSLEQAKALPVPQPGDKRTAVYLDTARLLSKLPGKPFVFGGCIGPFTLAARLAGVSEVIELTVTEPALIHALVEKCAVFLANYLKAFRAAGAQGIIMAEPAAGLLSPGGLSVYSSAYIKRIAAEASGADFSIVVHNCAARLLHLPAILETGLKAFHFGVPMDIAGALGMVPADVVLCGNLDPAATFVQQSPADITAKTAQLLAATAARRNFVISSGCDLPPNTPLASLDAFCEAVEAGNK